MTYAPYALNVHINKDDIITSTTEKDSCLNEVEENQANMGNVKIEILV